MSLTPLCPSPSVMSELLKALPSIVTAVTAVIGVLIAKRGLDRWHVETIGRRKAELAEQALTAFYEVRDVFIWVRSPGMFGGEGERRKANTEESEKQRGERNLYFVPLERLTHEAELFAKIHALRYSYAAYFGKAALAPFQAIRMAQAEITSAAGVLIQITNEEGSTSGYGGRDSGADLRKVIWGSGERPDKLDHAIDEAVQQIEELCRPVLEKAAP